MHYLLKPESILSRKLIEARLAPVIDKVRSVNEVINCLEEFEFCFKLSEKEEKETYRKQGYLFPSLRPSGGVFGISKDLTISICSVIDVISSESSLLKTIGVKIVNKNEGSSIGSYFFSRFQVESRKYHCQEQPIYANGVQLQNGEQFAIVWLNSRADMIQAVIQGDTVLNLTS